MTKIKNISRDIIDIIEECDIGSEKYRKICGLCKELYDINCSETDYNIENQRYHNILQECNFIIKDITNNLTGLSMYMTFSIIMYTLLIILYIVRNKDDTKNEVLVFDLIFNLIIFLLFIFVIIILFLKYDSKNKLEKIKQHITNITNIEINVI